MSTAKDILAALRIGPLSNVELQVACLQDGATIAAVAAQLRRKGLIERVDGHTGRGRKAVYRKTA